MPEADLSDSASQWLLSLQRWCWWQWRWAWKWREPIWFSFSAFFAWAQEKLSGELNGASDCPCSRASPGNKSGIKRIFSIATKMASKAADGDKKTWKEPPRHLCLEASWYLPRDSLVIDSLARSNCQHYWLFISYTHASSSQSLSNYSSTLESLDKRPP